MTKLEEELNKIVSECISDLQVGLKSAMEAILLSTTTKLNIVMDQKLNKLNNLVDK